MCTAIIKRGTAPLYGFNLDLDPAVWQYRLLRNNSVFAAAITVGKTLYYTHGVNARGQFSVVPYMNGSLPAEPALGRRKERVDLLSDRYLRGKYDFAQLLDAAEHKCITQLKNLSLHGLFADAEGRVLLLEPGLGHRRVEESCFALTNYPLLQPPKDYNPWYGKERLVLANRLLKEAEEACTPMDMMEMLRQLKQEGKWATRLSFVYALKENAVYYVENNDFDSVQLHRLVTGVK